MSETIDIADVIMTAIAAKQNVIHVCMPGEIVKYTQATDRADVLPTVKRALPSDEGGRVFEALPTLPQIPVLWQRAGMFAVRGKLEAGDTGLIIFSSVPWGEWLATGESGSEPVEMRRHSIGYAAFIPGLYANTQPLEQADPIAGAAGTIGMHDNSGAAIGFSSGEIMAGAGGAALAKHAAIVSWAGGVESQLTAAGFPVANAFAAILDSATTILKGK